MAGDLKSFGLRNSDITALTQLPPSQPSAYFLPASGRRLAYDDMGAPDGLPLLFFHDGGNSRLQCRFFDRSARALGFRLIAVDRPGIGRSDFYPVLGPEEFCRDLLLLADHLGLYRFGLLSLGAGGIYALTLAHDTPQRVISHVNLAGVPGSVFNERVKSAGSDLAWNHLVPLLVQYLVRMKHRFFASSLEQSLADLRQLLSHADRKALADPAVLQLLASDYRESLRGGSRGVAQDLGLCFRRLGFSLRDVNAPTVIWQGASDRLAKRSDCEYMVSHMPHAHFHRVPSRGHFFFVDKMDEVFRRLHSSTSGDAAIAA